MYDLDGIQTFPPSGSSASLLPTSDNTKEPLYHTKLAPTQTCGIRNLSFNNSHGYLVYSRGGGVQVESLRHNFLRYFYIEIS